MRKWVLPPEHASKGVLVKPCGESLQGILVLHLQGDVDKVRADDVRAPDYAAGGANSAKGGSVQLCRAGGLDEHDVPERAVLLDGEGAEGDADEVISSPVQTPCVDGVVHVVEIAQVGTALPVQLFGFFPVLRRSGLQACSFTNGTAAQSGGIVHLEDGGEGGVLFWFRAVEKRDGKMQEEGEGYARPESFAVRHAGLISCALRGARLPP